MLRTKWQGAALTRPSFLRQKLSLEGLQGAEINSQEGADYGTKKTGT